MNIVYLVADNMGLLLLMVVWLWIAGGEHCDCIFICDLCLSFSGLAMKLNGNGEYTNIVVTIGREVPESGCDQLLSSLEVYIFILSGG